MNAQQRQNFCLYFECFFSFFVYNILAEDFVQIYVRIKKLPRILCAAYPIREYAASICWRKTTKFPNFFKKVLDKLEMIFIMEIVISGETQWINSLSCCIFSSATNGLDISLQFLLTISLLFILVGYPT